MKLLLSVALAAGVALTVPAPAAAADGCGRGFHRGPYGHCRPNVGPGGRYGAGPGVRPVIGNHYAGRGYWDGRRYWHNRYRHHDGWRYR